MHPKTVRSGLLALCLLSSTLLTAQSIVLPKNISFTGAPGYTQAELLSFTHLTPASSVTLADLQAVAQRFSDTGLFSDVRFSSNAAGLVFALKPMPANSFLAPQFANLAWWTPEQLNAALQSRIPLYHGAVPTSGNIQDSLIAALKAMLAEKNVTASIVALPIAHADGSASESIKFLIESPAVRVHAVSFAAASPDMQTKLNSVVKDAIGQPYDQLSTEPALTTQITSVYRDSGYLDAGVTSLTHAQPQVAADGIDLDLTATLHEGEPYRLSKLQWSGSDIMSTADFDKQAKLKPEEIASQTALRQSLSPLAGAYYAKGYQDAKVQAPATLDSATHHVSYTVRVVPGEQYRLHSVRIEGANDQQRKDFDSTWKMKPGDFYDLNYLTTFLNKNTALRSFNGYSGTYKAFSDPNTHLVDLVITFVKGGTLIQVN